MPTSEPWNPNPTISDDDRARGYWVKPCYSEYCGPDCLWCNGTGELREPIPEYRPDKKIRCTVWLPHGEAYLLFWDDGTLSEFQDHMRHGDKYTIPVRGWDHAKYEIRPSAITLFRRNDPK